MAEETKKLTSKDDKLEFCRKWIKRIDDSNIGLKTHREEALRAYANDPSIVKLIKGRSDVTTTDFMDAVESAKPDLLEIFASGDDVVTLDPGDEKDVHAVKLMEALINKQVRRKNKWFLLVNDFLDDCLKLRFGAFKYQWFKDTKTIDKDYEDLDQFELAKKLEQDNVTVLRHEERIIQEAVMEIDPMTGLPVETQPAVKAYDVTLRYTVEDEYPLIEVVPADEIGFPINAKSIDTAPFVYHKFRKDKWDFIDAFGEDKFKKVEKVKTTFENDSQSIYHEQFKDYGGEKFFYDSKEDLWCGYECYYKNPDTGEAWILAFCADEILMDEKNPYGKPCFEGATSVKLAHRAIGYDFYDLLKELMKERTTLKRQIYDNLYQANFRRYFGDPKRLNLDDYLNNNTTNALIRTKGDPTGVVLPEEKAQLPPEVFQYLEMLNVEKDEHTITPRAAQGLNSKVLNDTFRGQNQQVQKASQRKLMLARLISEMAIAPLMKAMVDCNLRFLKKKTSIRYMNEWIELNPDNIICDADTVVNVGLGTGNKDNIIAQMQQGIGLDLQILGAGLPAVTPTNLYNKLKELYKAMGFKNTSDFTTDPGQIGVVTQLLQYAQQIIQMQQGQDQQLIQLVQQVSTAMNIPLQPVQIQQQPQQGGQGTFPGQNVPAQAQQPSQAMNPRQTPGGGDFYA